jgi:hypothetical protein
MVSCEEPASGAGLDLSAGIIATMSYRRSEKVSGPDKAAESRRSWKKERWGAGSLRERRWLLRPSSKRRHTHKAHDYQQLCYARPAKRGKGKRSRKGALTMAAWFRS